MQVIQEAGKILREGGLVAFPTETVYGIGANALDEEAIKKIYLAKGRPSDNPLIMHISDLNTLDKYVNDINEKSNTYCAILAGAIDAHLHKKNSVPDIITGGLETVAVRMPKHRLHMILFGAQGYQLLRECEYIWEPSPTRGRHVMRI